VRRVLQISTGILLGATVGVLLIATGALGPRDPETASATGWDPYPAPPLRLTQADGSVFDLTASRGEVALVFFGYASCPDFCPLTLSSWTQALRELRADGRSFQGIFVSVDPARDTPEVLRSYMRNFDPSIVALSGSEEELVDVARDWGIYFRIPEGADGTASHAPGPGAEEAIEHHDPTEGGYAVEHSTYTFLIDRDGRVAAILSADFDAESLIRSLEPFLD